MFSVCVPSPAYAVCLVQRMCALSSCSGIVWGFRLTYQLCEDPGGPGAGAGVLGGPRVCVGHRADDGLGKSTMKIMSQVALSQTGFFLTKNESKKKGLCATKSTEFPAASLPAAPSGSHVGGCSHAQNVGAARALARDAAAMQAKNNRTSLQVNVLPRRPPAAGRIPACFRPAAAWRRCGTRFRQ